MPASTVRTRIKFCGCTSPRDADMAVDCGVDAIGVIFAPASPRRIGPTQALAIAAVVPPYVTLVGVFVDPPPADVRSAWDAGFVPQFSGHEDGAACEAAASGPYIKVFHIALDAAPGEAARAFAATAPAFRRATWMFDTTVAGKAGGTGRIFDWTIAEELARNRRVIVSGGLTPENVGACVRTLRPYAVDVRSGIETDGVKDSAKMRAFVRAVKEADEQA